MAEPQETADEKKARDQLAAALKRTPPAGMAAFGKDELCQRYRALKPTIDAALKFIGLIPRWGAIIVETIKTLEGIADNICP
jgi:hypothetical protein